MKSAKSYVFYDFGTFEHFWYFFAFLDKSETFLVLRGWRSAAGTSSDF